VPDARAPSRPSCPRFDPWRRLEKLTFQILRRTYATRAIGERKGTLKDVQKQLRQARPDTPLENYVKDIQESVYTIPDSMYEMIHRVTAGPLAQLPLKGGTVKSIDQVLNTEGERTRPASC